MNEDNLYYIHRPAGTRPLPTDVDFMSITEFLADEPACKTLWEMITTQFRTRSKFLAIWSCVKYVCVHRNNEQQADGFLLISAPVNWQIDYVVVKPECRGQGIAKQLLDAALSQASYESAPYVMLTSKASLRPLYESVGFEVVATRPIAMEAKTG